MIDQEYLKSILNYDPENGLFRWKKQRSGIRIGDVAGCIQKYGYRRIKIDGKLYLASRLAWLYYHGEFPQHEVDHINHIRDDNRILNLREVTHQENNKNKSMQCDNTSGTTGVYWNKRDKKWVAHIQIDGKSIYLGRFSSKSDAVEARKQAEIKYNFHINHGK